MKLDHGERLLDGVEHLGTRREQRPLAALDDHPAALGQEAGRVPGARADLHAHELVVSGALLLQDKASCFPATALLPAAAAAAAATTPTAVAAAGAAAATASAEVKEGDWIDACAAPGNKTTQLAELVGAHGAVY